MLKWRATSGGGRVRNSFFQAWFAVAGCAWKAFSIRDLSSGRSWSGDAEPDRENSDIHSDGQYA